MGDIAHPPPHKKKRKKKTLCLDQDFFWGEGKEGKYFYYADCLFFLWEGRGQMERAHVIDGLIDVNQKVPDWLMKIIFLRLKQQLA